VFGQPCGAAMSSSERLQALRFESPAVITATNSSGNSTAAVVPGGVWRLLENPRSTCQPLTSCRRATSHCPPTPRHPFQIAVQYRLSTVSSASHPLAPPSSHEHQSRRRKPTPQEQRRAGGGTEETGSFVLSGRHRPVSPAYRPTRAMGTSRHWKEMAVGGGDTHQENQKHHCD